MRGWFVAPATTNYRFYVACDNKCRVKLGNSPMDADDTTQINYNEDYTGFRNFWDIRGNAANPDRMSEWISLTEGEHYYMESQHLGNGEEDHFSVAVEIKSTGSFANAHHQSMREIQKLQVETGPGRDTMVINITNSDGGTFMLAMTNSKGGVVKTGKMSTNIRTKDMFS